MIFINLNQYIEQIGAFCNSAGFLLFAFIVLTTYAVQRTRQAVAKVRANKAAKRMARELSRPRNPIGF